MASTAPHLTEPHPLFSFSAGWTYCRIDGAVQAKERQAQIVNYNKSPDQFIFLLSTRAGGLGNSTRKGGNAGRGRERRECACVRV